MRAVIALCLWMLAAAVGAAPAADPWPMWDAHDQGAAARIDHSRWQTLLDAYVQPSPDGIHRVRYEAVDGALLADYIDAMTALDPRRYRRDEQMAYWINLYNALTVRVVLEHPGERSIRSMGRSWFSGPWDDVVASVAGEPLTLNDIEHRILRPIWRDHRIHYAVNCASVGCPDLARAAYDGAQIEAQLAAAERAFLRSPRAVSFDARGRLTLSKIFDWYQRDFAADEDALLENLATRLPDLADQLRGYKGRVRYAYDWSLNATE